MKQEIEINEWIDKREMIAIFKEFYQGFEDLSSHRFTKMIKDFAVKKELEYDHNSTGGNYLFIIKKVAA